jgi:hypothetical protein
MEEKTTSLISISLGGFSDKQYRHLVKLMSQLDTRIEALNTRLDEATSEILALLGQLNDETLSAEGQAALAQAETKVAALADIVPGPTPGTPEATPKA